MRNNQLPAIQNIFMRSANSNIPEFLMNCLKIFSLLLIVLSFSVHTKAQVTDSAKISQEKFYKNVIKLNITSFILYTNGIQLNYERLLSKKRSITLFGGYIEFPMPTIISNSPLNFDKNRTKGGFSIGSEYRFYLAKENKYAAPHGIYLAPFLSYYHFSNSRSGRDTTNPTNQLVLSTNLDFLNIGGELGYQFVIKNRFVIDCVLVGPALSSYYFSLKVKGSTGDYNEHLQEILDALKEKYPLFNTLSNGGKISTSGVSNFWSIGFRYAIHIGYRF